MDLKVIYQIKKEIQSIDVKYTTDESNSQIIESFNEVTRVDLYSGECSILISDFKQEYRKLLNFSNQSIVESRKSDIDVIIKNSRDCIKVIENDLYHNICSRINYKDKPLNKKIELNSPFVEVQLNMLLNIESILKNFTKLKNDLTVCEFISDYKKQELFSKLASKNKYNATSEKWIDKSSGYKSYVASLIKSLHPLGYLTCQPSNSKIILMSKELFDIDLKESTVCHATSNNPQLKEIFQ